MTDPRRLLDDGSEASPALRALLASARRGDDPRARQIEALSARLAASVAPIAPIVPIAPAPQAIATAAASAGRAAFAAKACAMIAVLGVVGSGAWYVHATRDDARTRAETRPARRDDARTHAETRPARRDDARTPAEVRPAIGLDASPLPSTIVLGPPADVPIEEAPQPPPTLTMDSAGGPPRLAASPRQPRGPGDSEAETKLVVAAGAALVANDAEAALALTREHLTRFPNGAHAEERDRIAIEALVRLGGLEGARAAADRFFTRYPQSVYRSRVESLVR